MPDTRYTSVTFYTDAEIKRELVNLSAQFHCPISYTMGYLMRWGTRALMVYAEKEGAGQFTQELDTEFEDSCGFDWGPGSFTPSGMPSGMSPEKYPLIFLTRAQRKFIADDLREQLRALGEQVDTPLSDDETVVL